MSAQRQNLSKKERAERHHLVVPNDSGPIQYCRWLKQDDGPSTLMKFSLRTSDVEQAKRVPDVREAEHLGGGSANCAPGSKTFGKVAAQYLKGPVFKGLAATTQKDYAGQLRERDAIQKALGGKRLDDTGRADLQAWWEKSIPGRRLTRAEADNPGREEPPVRHREGVRVRAGPRVGDRQPTLFRTLLWMIEDTPRREDRNSLVISTTWMVGRLGLEPRTIGLKVRSMKTA